MLNVAGVSVGIATVVSGSNIVRVMSVPSIPFILHDDDDDMSTLGEILTDDIESRLAQVYILPLFDGGGCITNNTMDVPFVRNTEYSDAYRWDSRQNCVNAFWTIYLLAGFQDSYMNLTYDHDPDNESATWASANNNRFPIVGGGAGGVIFYLETMRDGKLEKEWRKRVTVHEIGHNFNCPDRYNSQSEDGIMHGIIPTSEGIKTRYEFIPEDVHTIREQRKPKS
jgi:hypothetical protein